MNVARIFTDWELDGTVGLIFMLLAAFPHS
jgi:hypothetical protein